MEIKSKLESVLREHKEAGNKISKGWLASELGVSRQSITNYIDGKYYPTLDKALLMARLLDRKVEDIFELKERESDLQ
ncbi:putative transcriptional regulator [Seinonella peptonophila]|uniref:Putative transcriptional regulator n=1 Tax=Seinonella peptonophila TaxID=112248 RepID=A0A1M4VAE9_9BACL|nr:helix-turn-helix domain-containing protein [Seinonella peptonophila]SHE65919.1 putative transcriptional regulator [Seinonella peptonophila]